MTVGELASSQGYIVVSGDEENLNQEVKGVYACDLLSHAMAKVEQGEVWITVHTNLNVIAVASLKDAACVLIPESIPVDAQTVERAKQKGIAILSSDRSASRLSYDILSLIHTGTK
jgi:hypothetical protein